MGPFELVERFELGHNELVGLDDHLRVVRNVGLLKPDISELQGRDNVENLGNLRGSKNIGFVIYPELSLSAVLLLLLTQF